MTTATTTAETTRLTRPLALARGMEVAWVHAVTLLTPQPVRAEERRERLQILDLEIAERREQEPDGTIATDLLYRLMLGLPADVAHAVAAWRPCTNCVVRRALRAG